MIETRVPFTLNKVVSELNRLADGILREGFGLTYSQFAFLLGVSRGRLSLTQAANHLDISVAAVSKKVDWFVERGLVRRCADSTNARKVLLELTAKGRKITEAASAELDSRFLSMFTEMSTLDLKKLNSDLHVVLKHLAEKSEESK